MIMNRFMKWSNLTLRRPPHLHTLRAQNRPIMAILNLRL